MSTLDQTIKQAAELAYEQDADQVVGHINGQWAIAHVEDEGRKAQMRGHTFRVSAEGVNEDDMREFEDFLAQ